MRVLIVDDDAFALRLMARTVAAAGDVEAHFCASAAEALARLADEAPFDVLICDLNMPDMDGVQLLRALAQRRFAGGIVLVSGEGERILQSVSKLVRAHRLRLLGALSKPVSPARLRALLGAFPQSADPATGITRRRYRADELDAALAAGHLFNVYQPQVSLTSGEVVGVEALVRWQHPDDGLILPDQFIETAERNGLIDALTRTVLDNALTDARGWGAAGIDLRISINAAIDNLLAIDFPDRVTAAARAAGVDAARLVVEITESQAMRDRRALLDVAARLRLKRIGLSIDDFGSGFASLTQLRDLPVDELKLERSFVHGARGDAALQAMLRAAIGMARELDLRTVAEGVEDPDDWNQLRELGCDFAQGWFIARPMPAGDLPGWLAAWRAQRALQA